jgi:hypothetical protein
MFSVDFVTKISGAFSHSFRVFLRVFHMFCCGDGGIGILACVGEGAEYPTALRKKRVSGLEKKMEKQRSPGSAPSGRGFSRHAWSIVRCFVPCTMNSIAAAREVTIPALPVIGSMSPRQVIPRRGCVLAVPASVSPGKSILDSLTKPPPCPRTAHPAPMLSCARPRDRHLPLLWEQHCAGQRLCCREARRPRQKSRRCCLQPSEAIGDKTLEVHGLAIENEFMAVG